MDMFFAFHGIEYIAEAIAVFVAGFFWAAGNWVFARLVTPRPAPSV